MRGRLIFPFLAELRRLDTAAMASTDPDGAGPLTGGFDPDFKEPVLVDRDGDGFVAGDGCSVVTDRDCDDDDAGSFPGATETCGDGIDQNCRTGADERVVCGECAMMGPRECGVRRCRGLQDCDAAGFWGPCVPVVAPTPEICGNDEDDDCNGVIDDC